MHSFQKKIDIRRKHDEKWFVFLVWPYVMSILQAIVYIMRMVTLLPHSSFQGYPWEGGKLNSSSLPSQVGRVAIRAS